MSDRSMPSVNEESQLSNQITKFEEILKSYGLPSENIIASIDEREIVMEAMPRIVSKIAPEQKQNAVYLSKFIAGAAIGLFDASINFVWNEVVLNLRQKVVCYGLDLFYDSAIDEKKRPFYNTEEDLQGIKDKVLLDTLKKLELISDIVYRKLCHILDMRNQIGASHPNSYNINSYELLGWLQTCVNEVISDKPSNAAITVRQIMENIKKSTKKLDIATVNSFEVLIKDLSSTMASNLIVSLFGLFINKNTTSMVRINAIEISKVVWPFAKNEVKYDLGEKVDVYRNNLDEEKVELADTFFEKCNGLEFLTISARGIQLSNLCEELMSAHYGYNNYYNEPQYAKDIMKFIKKSQDIPEERAEKIINTFLNCRIGREVAYNEGVSPGARKYYDDFFVLLSKDQVIILLLQLKDIMDSISSSSSVRCKNILEILQIIKSPILGDRLNEIIDYMIMFNEKGKLHKVYRDQGFKELCYGTLTS